MSTEKPCGLLLALPLDQNSYKTLTLQPRFGALLMGALGRRLPSSTLAKAKARLSASKGDRRFYYRLENFTGPGWNLIRQEAETAREAVTAPFNRDVLDKILPPPSVSVPFPDGIIDSAKLKLVIGFMIWARQNLV